MNTSRYNKIAAAAYDRVASGTDEFDIDDVIAEIVAELSAEDTSAELVHEFAQTLAERVDDKRASRSESGQMDLLTGQPDALDAVWRLGGGRRVRARNATRTQMVAWLDIRGDNAARVQDAFRRDQAVVAGLLPYMTDADTTVWQAIAARREANPPLT